MKIYKIMLGIITSVLGFSLILAGWAMWVYGQWGAMANGFAGGMLVFFGLGVICSGIMLLSGTPVRDALGGVVTALPGHRGVGLRSGRRVQNQGRFKHILSQIILYTVLVIVVVLICIFSVTRVMRDFRAG